MVHSLYGWVDHIHTSVKVGYPPQSKKRRATTAVKLKKKQCYAGRQAGAPTHAGGAGGKTDCLSVCAP